MTVGCFSIGIDVLLLSCWCNRRLRSSIGLCNFSRNSTIRRGTFSSSRDSSSRGSTSCLCSGCWGSFSGDSLSLDNLCGLLGVIFWLGLGLPGVNSVQDSLRPHAAVLIAHPNCQGARLLSVVAVVPANVRCMRVPGRLIDNLRRGAILIRLENCTVTHVMRLNCELPLNDLAFINFDSHRLLSLGRKMDFGECSAALLNVKTCTLAILSYKVVDAIVHNSVGAFIR
mmetsp:Transcript_11660/g.22974  ORF Transcript_11660/g.22974 Transcript_11660/m.22974 type:complete len:227 (+) Transcript_11660:635-1315(+)